MQPFFAAMLGVVFAGAALVFRQIIGRPLAQFLSAIHAEHVVELQVAKATNQAAAHYEDDLSEVMRAYNSLMDTNAQQTQALDQAIEKLRDNEKHLVNAARRDPLTGLGNRLALEEALERAVARAALGARWPCVALGPEPIQTHQRYARTCHRRRSAQDSS